MTDSCRSRPLSTAELSVLAQAESLNTTAYDRLLLVSHRRHLPAAKAAGDGTLVYSTDWLTWRLCLDAGLEAVHFEGLLGDWPAERGDPANAHHRAWEWVYVEGGDATLFDDVSLGKLFIRNISLLCNAYARQFHALDRACARWKPREIVFIDLRAEYGLVETAMKRRIVAEVAGRHGARVIDRLDAPPSDDSGLPDRGDGYGYPAPEPWAKWAARGILSEALDYLCRMRDAFRGHGNKVLLLSNWVTVQGLLQEAGKTGPASPSIIAAHLPKRLSVIWPLFRRKVVMIGHPAVRLTRAERATVAAIGDRFEALWQIPVRGEEQALRDFVRECIFRSGWLELQALEVKRWRRLFRRHRFYRVLIGDATNGLCRLVAEMANSEGVPVDELFNGIFLTRQRYDARTGDDYRRPVVDRLFAWGPLHETWRSLTAPDLPCVRTGYPALDPMRLPEAKALRTAKGLVLPVYVDCGDTMGLNANIFTHLVAVVDGLHRIGCREIRVKVHPGPFNEAYYADVLGHFGLEAQIINDGPLEPHIDWADFVVGAANSGAFVETLARGKPYFPMVGTPTLIDDRLLGPVPTIADAEELIAAIEQSEATDRDVALEHLASFFSIPNAARRVWDVYEADIEREIPGAVTAGNEQPLSWPSNKEAADGESR